MNNWDIKNLCNRPEYRVIEESAEYKAVIFENEPFHGQPTEVFAYIGIPQAIKQPVPGMVCIHGGGGKAFKEWVELWVKRGYAAIAMDIGGLGIDEKRLEKAGPGQDHEAKFGTELAWEDLWTYHAVAAVIRANSLLSSFDNIDAEKIGVTGISWGGFLTCIVAGIDNRFKCAIPVYGCGFLQDNSANEWLELFAKMTPARKAWWHEHCDPSVYIENATMPMLFITGTNDFAYPLDSLKKTCSLPKGSVTLCVKLEMPHGHVEGWMPDDAGIFADAILLGEKSLPKISDLSVENKKISAIVRSSDKIDKALLLYSCDSGKWQGRKWQQSEAEFDNNIVSADLPDNATLFFLAIEDERGAYVSSVYEERS
ncbi:MAG: acetylxylan esterase [Victivallaceae bacterium]|nr:acetylxylan esterase [Victivallaceae bacterium]